MDLSEKRAPGKRRVTKGSKREACQDALKDKDVISKRVRLWGVPWRPLGLSSVFDWGRRFPLAVPHNGLQKKPSVVFLPVRFGRISGQNYSHNSRKPYQEKSQHVFSLPKNSPPPTYPVPRGEVTPPRASLHSGEKVKHSETRLD